MAEERVLALDLGGTKLLIGEVDRNGRVLNRRRYASGYRNQDQEMELIVGSLEDYVKTEGVDLKEIWGAGVGLMGQVDAQAGVWNMIDPDRKKEIPVAERLSRHFKVPFSIENDVKAAAKAEQIWGAGRGIEDFIYLNIGTGIAAGIISGGRLVRGSRNDAGEVGHICTGVCNDEICACGQKGCVENVASGGGMDRRVRSLAGRYPDSPLVKVAERGFVGAETIFSAAEARDLLALRITEDAAEAIAGLLVNLTRFSDPSRIILGGGIGGSPWIRERIERALRKRDPRNIVPELLVSRLSPDSAGLIGAAAVGMKLE